MDPSSMWSAASVNDQELRAAFLKAREARQHKLDSALELARSEKKSALLFIGTNIPGADKFRPGSTVLVQRAMESLQGSIGLDIHLADTDLLGPYRIALSDAEARALKAATITIETTAPSNRLLDLDVYGVDGFQVDRTAMLAPPRPCLLCEQPARECIRLGRHSHSKLLETVDRLLVPFVPGIPFITPKKLTESLVQGALLELQVTPKPGLVDRHDSGSHRDLTYAAMEISANLLSVYYAEILRSFQQQKPLQDFVQAGKAAEARMAHAIQANAHKGYIFLSGLVLLALCECDGHLPKLRSAISNLAKRFFAHFDHPDETRVRQRQAIGGIRTEAERGLPAIFDHGLPRYLEARSAGWNHEEAGYYAMAILMQQVEDTTAIQRCGPEGLQRLRGDGILLQRMLETRQCPKTWLSELNEDYRRLGLTMGGVADCMALIFAVTAPMT